MNVKNESLRVQINWLIKHVRYLLGKKTTASGGGTVPTNTSDLTNDGQNGTDPFITANDIPPGGGINNVVEDTTPQLGGTLDLNGNKIDGAGDIYITGTPPSPNSSSFRISYNLPSGAVKQVSNIQMTKTASGGSDVTFLQAHRLTVTGAGNNSQIRAIQNDITLSGSGNHGEVTGTRNSITHNGSGNMDFLLCSSHAIDVNGSGVATIDYARSNGGTITLNNTNAKINYLQSGHPNITLIKGKVGEVAVNFLDIDVTNANVGSTLLLQGNITYLQGGGGTDVATLKGQLTTAGYKGRFIWNQGTWESDFGGIINYTGNVSNITAATNKVLINKEFGDATYLGKASLLVTAPATATDTGVAGEIRIASDFLYICTSTNTWKRVALLTF